MATAAGHQLNQDNFGLRRLKIGPRLTLSFAIIAILTVVGSLVSIWQLDAMHNQAQRLHQADTEVEAMLQVHNSVLLLKDRLRELIDARDGTSLSAEIPQLQGQVINNLDKAIQIFESSTTPQSPNEYKTYLVQLKATRASLSSWADLLVQLAQVDDWVAAEFRLETPITQESQRIQGLVDKISRTVEDEQKQALANLALARQQTLTVLTITTLLILAAAILLGLVVTRSIAQPLARLDLGTQALARQAFDYRIQDNGDDELSQLSQVFNHTAAQLAELYQDLEQVVWQRTLELQESTEELHHRYLQLETSMGVGQRATSSLDLETLLHQVVELIKDRYGYYYVGVFLLDETKNYITAKAGTGQAGKRLYEEGFRLKVGEESISGWVAKYHQPLRVDDVSQDRRYLKVDIIPDTRSEFALPLAMGEKVLGVLDLQSDKLLAFPMADMPVLQSLADQLAIAIQNARLYQREKTRRSLAETLNDITRALSSTLDLSEVLNLILEHLASLVPYDRAAVILQEQSVLEVVAARGFPETVDPLQIRISLEEEEDDIFQEIYRTQQPLIIAEVQEHPSWQYITGLPEARAWLGIPLILADEVIGMLSLACESPNAYDTDQVQLAVTFAGQAAIAIENARLYEQIIRFNQYLEEVVRERTEALQLTNKQLEGLDQTKSDFIHIAAHELRTPLTILRGYSQILLKDPTIEQNELHREMITSIHSGAMRLHEIVNSMLDVTKIDSRALEIYPEPLSVFPLIEKICQKFNESFTQRQQTFEVKDIKNLPTIEADPDALHKVFYHLVGNAIKYTPDGGKITISGQPLTNGQQHELTGIEIVISDNGIGIDPEFQELIFTKFYQTGQLALHSTSQVNFKGAGPGLGLAIVKGIVEAHQGKVWVESEQHNEEKLPGSHFHVVLPLRQDKFASL